MFLLFSMLYILLGWVREMNISSVGFLRKDDLLRSTFYVVILPKVDSSFP
jgi:hypothetical protein